MNRVILAGRLVKDPDARYTQTGMAITRFILAVNRRAVKDGRQQADFIPIVAFNKLAETCGNNLSKGSRIIMAGRISVSGYEKDGVKKYATEVILDELEFVGKKPASSDPASKEQKKFGVEIPFDGDVPF